MILHTALWKNAGNKDNARNDCIFVEMKAA